MKKITIIGILLIIVAIFAVGCSKQAPMHPAEQQKIAQENLENLPDMPEANPEVMDEPVVEPEAEPKVEEPIGNRVTGNKSEAEVTPEAAPEQEEIGEEVVKEVPEDDSEGPVVNLMPDKTMDTGDMTVKVGTTVLYKNTDTWPHHLAVESGSGYDTVRHEDHRLEAGEEWSYTFEETGTFLVRDIYSGKMRQKVTVE